MSIHRYFWVPEDLEPIASLASLRELVLSHSDKRMPKWRFKLAPDLAVQIQPKPPTKGFFEGEAVTAEDVGPWAFDTFRSRAERDHIAVEFKLIGSTATHATHWLFRASRRSGHVGSRPRFTGVPGQGHREAEWRAASEEAAFQLRRRLINDLPTVLANITPSMMMAPQCLCCGRALTDPASMARLFGPECAGTASLAGAMFDLHSMR